MKGRSSEAPAGPCRIRLRDWLRSLMQSVPITGVAYGSSDSLMVGVLQKKLYRKQKEDS